MALGGDPRPNIVVILADDLGFSDIGCFGGEIATPNLDRLARGGVRFTDFYTCARCCPTRASLLTGLYPHQAGIGHMTAQTAASRDLYRRLGLDAYAGTLAEGCTTIAEVLRGAGYQTLHSGKWHVGQTRPNWPVDRGFDRFYGLISGGCSYFSPEAHRLFVDQETRVQSFPGDFYTTDYFTRHAVRFIDEADARRPFFLYAAYTAPHWPLHAWPRDIEKYRRRYRRGWDELRAERYRRQRDLGLWEDGVSLSGRDPESPPWEAAEDHERWDLRMAVYAAMVESMDRGVGGIMSALEQNGYLENTVVMFLSDNGACAETIGLPDAGPIGTAGSFTSCLLPWANASSTPFRLFKHWTHEGGIATPFIASWPARIAGPRIERRRIGHVKDIMPTCLELAGARYPAERNGAAIPAHSGTSLVPAFLGETPAAPQVIVWEHEGNRAVRLDGWKAVSYYSEAHGYVNQGVGEGRRTGAWELYDLANDRCELNDLSRDEPRRLQDLVGIYDDWADRMHVADWQDIQAAWGQLDDGDTRAKRRTAP